MTDKKKEILHFFCFFPDDKAISYLDFDGRCSMCGELFWGSEKTWKAWHAPLDPPLVSLVPSIDLEHHLEKVIELAQKVKPTSFRNKPSSSNQCEIEKLPHGTTDFQGNLDLLIGGPFTDQFDPNFGCIFVTRVSFRFYETEADIERKLNKQRTHCLRIAASLNLRVCYELSFPRQSLKSPEDQANFFETIAHQIGGFRGAVIFASPARATRHFAVQAAFNIVTTLPIGCPSEMLPEIIQSTTKMQSYYTRRHWAIWKVCQLFKEKNFSEIIQYLAMVHIPEYIRNLVIVTRVSPSTDVNDNTSLFAQKFFCESFLFPRIASKVFSFFGEDGHSTGPNAAYLNLTEYGPETCLVAIGIDRITRTMDFVHQIKSPILVFFTHGKSAKPYFRPHFVPPELFEPFFGPEIAMHNAFLKTLHVDRDWAHAIPTTSPNFQVRKLDNTSQLPPILCLHPSEDSVCELPFSCPCDCIGCAFILNPDFSQCGRCSRQYPAGQSCTTCMAYTSNIRAELLSAGFCPQNHKTPQKLAEGKNGRHSLCSGCLESHRRSQKKYLKRQRSK